MTDDHDEIVRAILAFGDAGATEGEICAWLDWVEETEIRTAHLELVRQGRLQIKIVDGAVQFRAVSVQ